MIDYEDRIICFIDIQGFKNFVNKSPVKQIKSVFDTISYFNDAEKTDLFSKSKKVTQFSDSIVISFKYNEESEVFHTLYNLYLLLPELIDKEVLLRGGITYGKMVHTDKYLFGPGYLEAYKIENEKAKYPRIIVDEKVINLGIEHHARHHHKEHERDSLQSMLSKDTDGYYYLDYIKFEDFDIPETVLVYRNALYDFIVENLKTDKKDVKKKYIWLKNKYNEHIKIINKYNHSRYKVIEGKYIKNYLMQILKGILNRLGLNKRNKR